MVISNEELKKIYFGAYSFEETSDGYLTAYQYTKAQMDYFEGAFDFWYDRSMATTAKTIEIRTDAKKISFDYKFTWKGSDDSFEIMTDGLITEIKYVKDLKEEGSLTFELKEGTKDIVIYLPADATVHIKNFDIDSAYEPLIKGEKVLWLGDSITQGYGPLRSSATYVSVANRLLGYDIINQGIGGYIYDAKSLMKMEGYTPDKIIVSLGTNQYGDGPAAVEEYYKVLMDVYGNDIPVLCISPIWRGDHLDEIEVFIKFCEDVKRIAGFYKNVTVVDGFKLLPHLEEYFLDKLHPNALGAEIYGRNLVEAIRKAGF